MVVANKCVCTRHKRKMSGVLCKMDFKKVYDRVDWQFLLYLLKRMSFGVKWRRMKECVSSASYSILVNGSPKGFFNAQRGLGQEDPPAPFHFVIVGEALSQMVAAVGQAGLILGFKAVENLPPISHLQFADDTLFFAMLTRTKSRMLKQH